VEDSEEATQSVPKCLVISEEATHNPYQNVRHKRGSYSQSVPKYKSLVRKVLTIGTEMHDKSEGANHNPYLNVSRFLESYSQSVPKCKT
jgi:hypothetical protein